MKKPTSAAGVKRPAKARRKTREELNQEARDRKRDKNIVAMLRVAVLTVAVPQTLLQRQTAERSSYRQ